MRVNLYTFHVISGIKTHTVSGDLDATPMVLVKEDLGMGEQEIPFETIGQAVTYCLASVNKTNEILLRRYSDELSTESSRNPNGYTKYLIEDKLKQVSGDE